MKFYRKWTLRYNHNHDEKGRFCSGGGGGRMSSVSSKKLYSNGGANPNKSVDKSEKSVDNSNDSTEKSSISTNESEKSIDNSKKSVEKTSEETDKSKKSKFSLTNFLNDATITDKEAEFKKHLANGDVNTTIEKSQQQKHQATRTWKNQAKQAIASNGRFSPKSLLDSSIDPQEFVNEYAGTGTMIFPKSGIIVHEFITTSKSLFSIF